MLKSVLVIFSILVIIGSFSWACVSTNQATENKSTVKPDTGVDQLNTIDEQRYLLKYDNGVFSDSYNLYDPRGLCVSFSPPVTPFKIKKVYVRGYRTDFPTAEKKTYTIKIWDGNFGKELFSCNYPYSKFSTDATMVEHDINPPLTVTDNFTVDFISHAEAPKTGENVKIGIYVTYDNTLSVNRHSGISWLGKYDEEGVKYAIKRNPKVLYACWMIQVQGSGQAISDKPQSIITVTENISTVVDGSYFAPFPCAATHVQIKEARIIIDAAMARKKAMAASAYAQLIGDERDKMYKAIEILEQCATKVTESECTSDEKNVTISSLYNDIAYCHYFLKNTNFASDYFDKALKANPNNKWASSNIQAIKDIMLPNRIVYFNLSK